MIRKLTSGELGLYSRENRKRRNPGRFKTRKAAEAHERAVHYIKNHGRFLQISPRHLLVN